MRGLLKIGICISITVILASYVWILTKKGEKDEPQFRGRSASYWGRAIKQSAAEAGDERSAITYGGEKRLPTRLLISLNLRHDDDDLRDVLYGDDRAKIPVLIHLLKHSDPVVRSHAATGIACPWRRTTLPGAEEAIPALALAVADEFPYVRRSVIEALKHFGPRSYTAVPALVKVLDDENEEVRSDAMYCLGEIGPEARDAVPALIKLLKSPEHRVRSTAAYAIGGIGPDAKQAVPQIMVLLKDDCMDVRDSAYYALETNDPEAYEKLTGQKPRIR